MKYIDVEKLIAEVKQLKEANKTSTKHVSKYVQGGIYGFDLAVEKTLAIITSLQQDETQVDKMLCSQVWWEEQGWIMIPPDATIEGIDSLLKQVRKKLQQESTPNTNILNTKLVNLLKKYRIGEETARTIADRIADTYGVQRYMDGLCDGSNEEDTKQKHSDMNLEKFTQKMDDWKSRYNYPDRISVKATMAFTARMFYMYPDIAREWYNGLPKATQD